MAEEACPAASTSGQFARDRKLAFLLDLRIVTFLEIRHRKPENARVSDEKVDYFADAGRSIANMEDTLVQPLLAHVGCLLDLLPHLPFALRRLAHRPVQNSDRAETARET